MNLEITRESSSRNVYIKPGEPAVLVCSLNQTVRWKKDGKIIVDNENNKIFENVLVVTSKDDKDYGEYFCELTNFKGKGIKMMLIKINEDTDRDNGDESKTYLILFIVALILLVFAVFVISYLLLRRKPNLNATINRHATARKNDYGQSNEIFNLANISSGEKEEDNYDSLANIKDEEPAYQSLVSEKNDKDLIPEKNDQDPESLYEDIPIARGKESAPKHDEHLYAEPIESSSQRK